MHMPGAAANDVKQLLLAQQQHSRNPNYKGKTDWIPKKLVNQIEEAYEDMQDVMEEVRQNQDPLGMVLDELMGAVGSNDKGKFFEQFKNHPILKDQKLLNEH